jgi:hypothetical protein
MVMVRKLRLYYDQPKYHALWGAKFGARRTEAIRADIISAYKEQHAIYLKEEEMKIRGLG